MKRARESQLEVLQCSLLASQQDRLGHRCTKLKADIILGAAEDAVGKGLRFPIGSVARISDKQLKGKPQQLIQYV